MRRRRPGQAQAAPPVPDPQYVEDWIDASEAAPALSPDVPGWRAAPLRGEPPEAVPWRVLAEERVDAAREERRAPLPDAEGIDVVATRAELPPGEPATEGDGPSWQFGSRCLWRDVEAFLALKGVSAS